MSARHVRSQTPQFSGSSTKFTHVPLQSYVSVGHTHAPDSQTMPPVHFVSQLPQCSELVIGSKQLAPH